MSKIIMELNGQEYESEHNWSSLEEFHKACPLENEFSDYAFDGSEGGKCYYYLKETEPHNHEFCDSITEETQEAILAYMESEDLTGDYLVLVKESREERIREYVKESAWAFNTSFILNHSKLEDYDIDVEEALSEMQSKLCESANPLILALIEDLDDFIADATSSDGYGHFLSQYDGDEHEITINGEDYFLYRQN